MEHALSNKDLKVFTVTAARETGGGKRREVKQTLIGGASHVRGWRITLAGAPLSSERQQCTVIKNLEPCSPFSATQQQLSHVGTVLTSLNLFLNLCHSDNIKTYFMRLLQ